MSATELYDVFLSYGSDNIDFVQDLALRLQGDARLSFWFEPWHSVPGLPLQEQMEEALQQAASCAVSSARPGSGVAERADARGDPAAGRR